MTDKIPDKKIDESWKEKAKTEPDAQETSKPEVPEADFKFFLTTLGMQAWISLGVLPNPMTQKPEENLNQAKFIIDTLDILKTKTTGNLDKEEAELLEQLLYELRMAYVSKQSGQDAQG
ncbi:MAG: DUF1844 domain-containing protein [Candidatus Omnitrophota bacterium]